MYSKEQFSHTEGLSHVVVCMQLLPSFSNIYKNTIYGDLSAQMLGLLASAGGIGALTGTNEL